MEYYLPKNVYEKDGETAYDDDLHRSTVKNISFASWKNLLRRAADAGTAELPIFVASSQEGSAKLIFRYWAVIDGKFVQDTAEQRISSVLPPLLPDMNLDGRIDTLR